MTPLKPLHADGLPCYNTEHSCFTLYRAVKTIRRTGNSNALSGTLSKKTAPRETPRVVFDGSMAHRQKQNPREPAGLESLAGCGRVTMDSEAFPTSTRSATSTGSKHGRPRQSARRSEKKREGRNPRRASWNRWRRRKRKRRSAKRQEDEELCEREAEAIRRSFAEEAELLR